MNNTTHLKKPHQKIIIFINIMKIMAKHKTEEHDFQCECVKWYRETFPEGIIFAVPNCGTRT